MGSDNHSTFILDSERVGYAQERMGEFAGRCRNAGLALTPQRMAIMRQLVAAQDHPRADQIHARLAPEFPSLSLATVHRTLETLCRIGEAHKVTRLHTTARYDGNTQPHQHLVCVSCEQVVDVRLPELADPLAGRQQIGDYEVVGCTVDIHVLCSACRSTRDQPSDQPSGGHSPQGA